MPFRPDQIKDRRVHSYLPRCEQTGKVCFNRRDAKRRARKIPRRGKLRCYRCFECGHWHLTRSGTRYSGK